MNEDDLKRLVDEVPTELRDKALREGGVVVMDHDGEWTHLPAGEHPLDAQMTRLGHGMIAMARCKMILKLVEGNSHIVTVLISAGMLIVGAALAELVYDVWNGFPHQINLSAWLGIAIFLLSAHLVARGSELEAEEADRIADEFIEYSEQSKVDAGEVTLQ